MLPDPEITLGTATLQALAINLSVVVAVVLLAVYRINVEKSSAMPGSHGILGYVNFSTVCTLLIILMVWPAAVIKPLALVSGVAMLLLSAIGIYTCRYLIKESSAGGWRYPYISSFMLLCAADMLLCLAAVFLSGKYLLLLGLLVAAGWRVAITRYQFISS